MRKTAILLLLLLCAPLARADGPETGVITACWVAGDADSPVTVTGLYLPKAAGAARSVFLGVGGEAKNPSPGGYGEIGPGDWHEVELAPGRLVLAQRPGPVPPAIVVSTAPVKEVLDIHELIHGEFPDGLFFFDRPHRSRTVTLDRHVVEIGGRVTLTVAQPEDRFFTGKTLEFLRVARRFPIHPSDDPDAAAGFVRVEWQRNEALTEIAGEKGVARLAAFFTDPECPFVRRYIGWMQKLWILEYGEPAAARFSLDTTPVKRAGRMAGFWRGYGAVTSQNIHANGFGGSSQNLTVPALLIVPEGTPVMVRQLAK